MSSYQEDRTALFSKPIEMKLAGVLFFAMRKNLMLFKDLGNEHIHYSVFIRGSLIDVHKTLEDENRHVPLAEIEFDWCFLLRRVIEKIRADWASILGTVKINDPRWKDLEVEFVPVQELMELLSPLIKGVRWNVDVKFFEKLESSLRCSRLGELADCGLIIGEGSGYFVMCNGTECFLLNADMMSKIIDKSIELSIRKIHLEHYTLSSVLWYVKMRVLILIHSVVRYFRKPKPQEVSASS